jgi:pre-mRNA-processing factor 6
VAQGAAQGHGVGGYVPLTILPASFHALQALLQYNTTAAILSPAHLPLPPPNELSFLQEAESAEKSQPPMVATCRAIVGEVVGHGVEEADRKRTWMADAEECMRRGAVETARAIYTHATSVFPGKKGVWRRAAELEKAHGTAEALDALLRRAVQYCPQAEVLWLIAAKEKWVGGDVAGARNILEEAFIRNPDSEEIWLAAFKVEFENNELNRAR